jgi:hypothetical protein
MRHDPALIVGIVVRNSRSVLCIRTSRAYNAVVGGIVVSGSPHACCSDGHGDLTLVILGLSWEVSSAPMRERRRRSASDESEMEVSSESEVPRDPSMGGLGRGGDTG